MRKPQKTKWSMLCSYTVRRRMPAIAMMCLFTLAMFALPVLALGTYVIAGSEDTSVPTVYIGSPTAVLPAVITALTLPDTGITDLISSQDVQVEVDGAVHTVAVQDETVEELLHTLGVELGESDYVSVPLDAPASAGAVVSVIRVTTATETHDEVVPAEDRVFLNTVLQPGQETVLEEGSDGLSTITTQITYENGVETAREVLSETVITPSQDRIVIRGAENADMPTGDNGTSVITAGGEVLEYSRVIEGKATAYNCPGYVGHTASGTVAEVGKVAVDPSVIPLGTKLYVVSQDGQYVYGYCIAEDTGGLIKGNKLDLYFSTWDECIQFGYRPVTIYVVDE